MDRAPEAEADVESISKSGEARPTGEDSLPASRKGLHAPSAAAPHAAATDGAVVVDADPFRAHLLAAWLAARHDLATLGLWHTLADATAGAAGVRPTLVVIAPDLPDGDGLRLLHGSFAARATAIILDKRHDVAARRLPEASKVAVIERHASHEKLASELDGLVASSGITTPATLVEHRLSPRERDVLYLMGEGLQSATIATRLGMSRLTVETHRKSIARKLGVTGAGLVRRAALHLSTQWPRVASSDGTIPPTSRR